MNNTQDEVSILEAKIAEADRDYWSVGISRFTDEEYDAMKVRLWVLKGKEDVLIHTPKVLSNGKVRHPQDRPMLSMRKAYQLSEVLGWWDRLCRPQVIAMPKYDGIALAVYPNGKVTTRGDGEVGEDVTGMSHMFYVSSGIRTGTVYGEAVIRKSIFEDRFREQYKNPRNAVSGILNSLDPEIQRQALRIDFVRYTAIVAEVTRRRLDPEEDFQEAADKVITEALDYPMDGVVFRVKDDNLFYQLGHTDHHWRGQIALKFANKQARTSILRIEWTVVNGTVTPVAHLKPIVIDGVEIRKATLHNADRVLDWTINEGVECVVERAGGVIPKIVSVVPSPLGPAPVPMDCPKCGSKLTKEGKRLYCRRCENEK